MSELVFEDDDLQIIRRAIAQDIAYSIFYHNNRNQEVHVKGVDCEMKVMIDAELKRLLEESENESK
jgi:hypothetical protein